MLTTLFNALKNIISPPATFTPAEGILLVEPRSQGPLYIQPRGEGIVDCIPRAEYSLRVVVRGQP